MFNQYGELIGLTSSGYDDTNAVINYAIPSENAKNLLSTAKFDPAKVEFLKPTLPDSLTGASEADIAKLMKDNFSSVSGSDGDLSLDGWKVERDSAGWLVIKANVNTSFYDYYGSKLQKDIRMWGENTAYELHRMLPKEQIQLSLIYDKTVDFEPRGYAAVRCEPNNAMAIGTCTTPFWMCSSRTSCCFVCGIRPSFWTVGLLSGGFFCAGSGAWRSVLLFPPEVGYNGSMTRVKRDSMNVVLSTLNAKFIHTSLALRCLKAYAEKDFPIEIAEYTIKDPVMNIVSDLYSKGADVDRILGLYLEYRRNDQGHPRSAQGRSADSDRAGRP